MGFNVTTLEDFQRSHGFDMLVLGNVYDGNVFIGDDQLKAVYSRSYRYDVADGVYLCQPSVCRTLTMHADRTVYIETDQMPENLYTLCDLGYKAIRVPKDWNMEGRTRPVLIDSVVIQDATAEYDELHAEKVVPAVDITASLQTILSNLPEHILDMNMSELSFRDVLTLMAQALGAEVTDDTATPNDSSREIVTLSDDAYAEMMDYIDEAYGKQPRTDERDYEKLCNMYPAARR